MQRFLLFFFLLVCFVITSCSDASTCRQNTSPEINPTAIRYDGQTYTSPSAFFRSGVYAYGFLNVSALNFP
ncbi:hypothetical protein G8759_29930 [Spirosoma aureum]|uniref:Uncharacterized protein n=1 Tax=Spirosoma aureum TaxID=2692134 RepID=A0A6G9AVQ6_9BACT|nr:hypothetical protein [Spirosoma aureum]QIP16561.1 hypothetical protein G8759_29930 [Spirosoma aureum]